MDKRKALIVVRLFFGLLTLYAIGVQLGTHLRLGFDPVNYFSYFTNLSNIILAVVFVIGALNLWQRRKPTPEQDLVRGGSVVYIAVVGIVYGILLRDIDLGSLAPWINTLLHYINPVVGIADWIISPPKSKLSLPKTRVWLLFPLVYLAYTLVRGALVNWYPYPFLNPATAGGYGAVALYSVAILAVFLAFSWIVIRIATPAKPESTPKKKAAPKRAAKKAAKKTAKKTTKKTAKQKSRR
ncbi:MAG: Pr6Pr family membrane protein [Anaerolineales bacterium]|nr:Pr6Pr family membrane protein [Anaerolineales bacterium]